MGKQTYQTFAYHSPSINSLFLIYSRFLLFSDCSSSPSKKTIASSRDDNIARVTKTRTINAPAEMSVQETLTNSRQNGKDLAIMMPRSIPEFHPE